VPEIKRMSDAEVAALRKELDGIKVRPHLASASQLLLFCMKGYESPAARQRYACLIPNLFT
jgi:hypothetical protein